MIVIEVHYGGGQGYSATVETYDEAINVALNAKVDDRAKLIEAKDNNTTIFTYIRYPRQDGQDAWKFRAMRKGL